MISYILAALTGLAVIGVDQWTKLLVIRQFEMGEAKPFINGVLDFLYTDNGGGAWGILQNHTWLLLSLTVIIMLICIAMLIKYGVENKLLFWAICLILGGGLGNMIDRIFRHGRVIDFLHISFFDFPIFNVADCAVCVGACLLVIYFVVGMIHDEANRRKKTIAAPVTTVVSSHTETEKIHVSEQDRNTDKASDTQNGTD